MAQRLWSSEEYTFLHENYQSMTNSDLALALHRTYRSIVSMLSYRHLKRPIDTICAHRGARPAAPTPTEDRRKKVATSKLNNAVNRCDMRRGRCVVCGKPNAEGHHKDYDKPLDVVWLCPSHHRQWHCRKQFVAGQGVVI